MTEVVLALLVGPLLVLRYPAEQQAFVALVIGLALASVSKAILDGGPLAYDTVAAWIFLWVLGEADSFTDLTQLPASRWYAAASAVFGWLVIVGLVYPHHVTSQVTWFVYRAGVHALILSAAAVLGLGVRKGTAVVAFAALAICVGAFAAEAASEQAP